MTRVEYTIELKRLFAKYGFIDCPLFQGEIEILWCRGISLDGAYGIGCDVNAGYTFQESLATHLNGE